MMDALMARMRLPDEYALTVRCAIRPIAARITRRHSELGQPICVGLCGSQGSGKSTMAEFLCVLLERHGLHAVVLSLDDLYLSLEARERLARDVHPLLRTRGAPGTHDVALGLEVLDALCGAGGEGTVALPRFDKAADNLLDRRAWPLAPAPADVVIFEGWCVGARPQPPAALAKPVNALEREQDGDGSWRRFVNDRLAHEYQSLFSRLHMLILLLAPDFEAVCAWRALQEEKLAEALRRDPGESGRRAMTPEQLARFMMHFQRLTEAMFSEGPGRADVVVRLTREQLPQSVSGAGIL